MPGWYVKSASRPVSQDKLEVIKAHAKTPKGKPDKYGNAKKFCQDLDSDWTVNLSTASHHDSKHFPYAITYSMHTSDPIEKAFRDKGYIGTPNREFLSLNNIKGVIMRKNNINAKLTDFEIERSKAISKYRYIVEQYFGITHKYDNGNKARFTTIFKNLIDLMFRQFILNLKKGSKILEIIPV